MELSRAKMEVTASLFFILSYTKPVEHKFLIISFLRSPISIAKLGGNQNPNAVI